jgi:hypothetical protein
MAEISTVDYLKWVQRSLNRVMSSGLSIDGADTAKYRLAVQRFNGKWSGGKRDDSKVDKATQDELIAHNYTDQEYVGWIQEALASVLGLRLDASVGVLDRDTVKATKAFQKAKGLHPAGKPPDGWVGPKTETALMTASSSVPPASARPRPVAPSPPSPHPSEQPTITPLTRNETRLFVWMLIGEQPREKTTGQLAREFDEFTGLQDLLAKPSLIRAFIRLGKVYGRVFSSEFTAEPQRQYGFLVGQAYAIVDAATGHTAVRRLPESKDRQLQQYNEGFNRGYVETRGPVASLRSDPSMAILMKRLAAGRHTAALRGVYIGLFEVLKPKFNTLTEHEYFLAAGRNAPSFSYPQVGVRPKPDTSGHG